MDGKDKKDAMYRQNLALGHRINTLMDRNNFYRVQINNFNKLTNSINKDLLKLGLNFQNKKRPEESAKIAPLFVISNKIQLKNLQMNIGNAIRKSEKFKKNLQGSPSLIAKEIEELEQQISMLVGKTQQIQEQNKLLKNIQNSKDIYTSFNEFQQQITSTPEKIKIQNPYIDSLKNETMKNLDHIQKEVKERNIILSDLLEDNQKLESSAKQYKKLCPINGKQNQLRACQAQELEELQKQQKRLLEQIRKFQKVLDEQYTINKDYKQRIVDKKYQQNKQIKVLEEEVLKCREQVKEFKQKYKDITSSSAAKNKYI